MKCNLIRIFAFVIAVLSNAPAIHSAQMSPLRDELDKCFAQSRQQGANLSRCESAHLELCRKYTSPGERGEIMLGMARMYFTAGASNSTKIIEYSAEALKCPIPPADACEMHIMRGRILERDFAKNDTENRRRVSEPFVRALALISEYLKNSKLVDLPGVGKFDMDPRSPEYAAAVKNHTAQMAARTAAEDQNRLVGCQLALRGNLWRYYGRLDSPELKADIQETIGDSAKVERMLEVLSRDLLVRPGKVSAQ